MKRSAEFVADELRQVGIDAKVVQSRNPDGTPGAWEVIGSKIVDPQAPTVLLYAHHDVQPVPDPSAWDTDPFVATEVGTRLYGRGSADDGGGIAIHSGAMKALGDDLKVNIKVFVEGEEEMGSPSFIPFIEDHRDEFASDVIVVADSGNWSAEIPSLTTSLRGNTCVDVNVKVLHHPVHSGQYGGPSSMRTRSPRCSSPRCTTPTATSLCRAWPRRSRSVACSATLTRPPCARTPASSTPIVSPAPVRSLPGCGPSRA